MTTDPIAEIQQLADLFVDERFGLRIYWDQHQAIKTALDAYADLLAQPRARTWQPIETAPKDGTAILVYEPIYTHTEVARYHKDDHGEWEYAGEYTIGPTHWMPLPDPPAREQEPRT